MAAMLIPLSAVCFSCTKTDSSSSESSIESSESYKEFEKAAPSNSSGNGFFIILHLIQFHILRIQVMHTDRNKRSEHLRNRCCG